MPVYGTLNIPPALLFGDQISLWNNENPVAGSPSERIAVTESRQGLQQFVRIQLHFSGQPGAFQVDIQTADTDADPYFVTQWNTSMAKVNAGGTGSFQYMFQAKFLRLIMTTSPANNVTTTAMVTRGGV
jgi:hypothetical protein